MASKSPRTQRYEKAKKEREKARNPKPPPKKAKILPGKKRPQSHAP